MDKQSSKLSYIRFLIYTLIISSPLGIFSRITIAENISIYSNDILIVLIAILWVFEIFRKRTILKLSNYLLPVAFFILACLISLIAALKILGLSQLLISSLYLVRFVEYFLLAIVVSNVFQQNQVFKLENLLITSGLLLSILGFVQYAVIPDFSSIAAEGGWDPHQYRLLSTFFDPNFLGLYLSLTLTILCVRFLSNPKKSWVSLLFILVIVAALVLTYSRSAYLAFIAALVVLGVLRWRVVMFVIPILAIVVALIFPRVWERFEEGVNSGTSGEARLVSWQNAWEISKDNILLGVGFNSYRYIQTSYGFLTNSGFEHSGAGSDSSILLVLATTGLLGLSAFLTVLASLVTLGFRLVGQRNTYGYILLASLASILIHSQFVNSFFFPWIMEWLWVVVGISLVRLNEKK